jgi:hypothetical protein
MPLFTRTRYARRIAMRQTTLITALIMLSDIGQYTSGLDKSGSMSAGARLQAVKHLGRSRHGTGVASSFGLGPRWQGFCQQGSSHRKKNENNTAYTSSVLIELLK